MSVSVDHIRISNRLRHEILYDPQLIAALRAAKEVGASYFPSAGNLGDGLIALGTLDLFSHIGWTPSAITGWDTNILSGVDYVVVGGSGGWVEGLWGDYARVLEPFLERGGCAVILPSTINGFSEFFRRYGSQIILFTREHISYERMRNVKELEGRVHLCHDLAFAANLDSIRRDEANDKGVGVLSLFRKDQESLGYPIPFENVDLALLWNGIQWVDREMCLGPLIAAAEIISQFNEIHTDRLHMTVLSAILGRQVKMHANAYFKNRGVYEYSLSEFKNVSFQMNRCDGEFSVLSKHENSNLAQLLGAQRAQSLQLLADRDQLFQKEAVLNQQVAMLNGEVASRESQIGLFESQIGLFENEVASLKGKVESRESQMELLGSEVTLLKRQVPEDDFRKSLFYSLWLRYLDFIRTPLANSFLSGVRKMVSRFNGLRGHK